MNTATVYQYRDVKDVKRRLSDYRELDRYIDNQVERFENLTSKMYYLGAQELTDMPKSPNTVQDRTGLLVAQKEELEKKIGSLIERRTEEKKWIMSVLSNIGKADEVTVIECRYIDGADWKTIAKILFGMEEDYADKEESYLRRCTKLHGRALVSMLTYIRKKAQEAQIADYRRIG